MILLPSKVLAPVNFLQIGKVISDNKVCIIKLVMDFITFLTPLPLMVRTTVVRICVS